MEYKTSALWYILAVLSLIIGIVIGFSVACKQEVCEADRASYHKASLFLLGAVAFGVLGVIQAHYDFSKEKQKQNQNN